MASVCVRLLGYLHSTLTFGMYQTPVKFVVYIYGFGIIGVHRLALGFVVVGHGPRAWIDGVSRGNMQSRMVPSSCIFKDLPLFGHVLYDADSSPGDAAMLDVYEFKYFRFEGATGTVSPKMSPSAEASCLFEHQHMRIARTLYDMESYWVSDARCEGSALLCWMHFPRLTPKRKRDDTDLRAAQRDAARSMYDQSQPLEVHLLTGETKLYHVANAFFRSDSPVEAKTGFAMLEPVAAVPRATTRRA